MVTRILNDRVPDLRLHGIPDSVCSVLERRWRVTPSSATSRRPRSAPRCRKRSAQRVARVTPMVVDTNLAALPPHELVTAVPGQSTTPTPLPERPSVDAGTAAAAGAAAIGAGVGAAAASCCPVGRERRRAAVGADDTVADPSTSSPATKSGPPEPSPAILAAAAAATAGATAGGAPSGSTGTASPTTPTPTSPAPPPVTPPADRHATPAPPASPWTPATGAATAAAAGAAAGATVTESRRGTWPRPGLRADRPRRLLRRWTGAGRSRDRDRHGPAEPTVEPQAVRRDRHRCDRRHSWRRGGLRVDSRR